MHPKTKAVSGRAPQRKKQHTQTSKLIFTVTKILIVFFIAIICTVTGLVGGAIWGYIKTASPITPDMLQLKNLTSFVYDSKGEQITQLRGMQNRILVNHNDIPDNLRKAYVAIEDTRFYQHPGVDIKGIANMLVGILLHGVDSARGGSTITQQLVRNITLDTERNLRRKVQEWWQAIQLEKELTKDDILDDYMNLIYMGEGCYGVQSASKIYLGKDVKDLSLAECAVIASITNSPGLYSPFTDKGLVNLNNRKELCLKLMLKQGKIDQNQFAQAQLEVIHFAKKDSSDWNKAGDQSWFVDQVIEDVKNDLMEQYNMSTSIALTAIYNHGYKIYTTQDTEVQKNMDEVFNNDKYFPMVKGRIEHPQAAMVVIDPKTGRVVALYGGYGEKKGSLLLNRATQMERPAGSSFKPLAVYGPAIDTGLITPATIVDDTLVYFNEKDREKPYPTNYESTVYKGLVSIHDAVINSINVVAAKVYLMNPDLPFSYLKSEGIDRSNERYISLALGGLNKGVNPLLMAAAYVPFDNSGMYWQPTTYTRVEDKNGRVILEKKSRRTTVYKDERTSFVMTSMLQDVVKEGTAYPFGIIKNSKGEVIPTAGKTGTSNDFKDKWFVGYSPYYVAATWYGYDHPVSLKKAEYNQALSIWNAVMTKVHSELVPVNFQEPSGIVRKNVCRYSGKVPGELCALDPRNSKVPAIREEVFFKGMEPRDNDLCNVHVLARVCKESKDLYGRNLLAGPNCPVKSIVERVFIKRKVPYMPLKPDDPKQYPQDWIYEEPAGEYCNVHGSPSSTTDYSGAQSNSDTSGAGGAAGAPGTSGGSGVSGASGSVGTPGGSGASGAATKTINSGSSGTSVKQDASNYSGTSGAQGSGSKSNTAGAQGAGNTVTPAPKIK